MRINLRSRMAFGLMLLMVVCLVVTIYISYGIVSTHAIQRSLADKYNILSQIQSQVESAFQEIELFSRMICTDDTIYKPIVHNDSLSISQQTEIHYDVMTRLHSYAVLCQYVDTFVIQRDDGEVYTSMRGYEDDYKKNLQQSWYLDFLDSGKNGTFSQIHRFFTPYNSVYVDGVSYILRYLNLQDQTYAHVIAEVRWSHFEKLLAAYDNSNTSLYFLDENHQALDAALPDLPEGSLEAVLASGYTESDQVILLTAAMQHPEWTLLLVMDRTALQNEMFAELSRYLLLEVLLFAVIMLLSTSFVFKKTKPIRQLKGAMQAISRGDLDISLNIHSGDELELLASGMNEMSVHLKAYIRQLLEAEQEKRKMQSELLLSQIKPHFIYNTLNSATYLIEEGKYDSAIRMILSLIALLQEIVHFFQTDSLNSIQSEIKIQMHYLEIQSIRYPNRFCFETNVEVGLEHCLMPRMMLQPLIENALIHGIVPAERFCVLTLSFTQQNETLRIEITDNGVGMDAEKLQLVIQADSERSGTGQGVAIRNIMRRLDLIYGVGNAKLTLQSEAEHGTTVVLLLPIQRGEANAG